MAKLLMVVSSARTIRLADGSDHPTGYLAEEVLEPYEMFEAAGVDVVIASPEGKVPQPDPWGFEPYFHYPKVDEDFMFSVLRRFAYHREILSCDGVFIPGGHGPMVDLADNADAGRVLRLMHGAGKIVAAPCHGAAALLSAPEVDGAWMFDGYRMTALTDEEDDQSKPGKIGLPWSLEAALKNRGAIFDDGDAAWVSHVVIDRNLITGQNPGSADAAAGAVLKRLTE